MTTDFELAAQAVTPTTIKQLARDIVGFSICASIGLVVCPLVWCARRIPAIERRLRDRVDVCP